MGALTPEKGLLCAGCPHRGAYLAAKQSVRGTRGAVVCGNVGCPAVGFMYPGAATCLGGMDRLPARYRVEAPEGAPACVHFVRDTDLRAAWESGSTSFSAETLAREAGSCVLGVLASSAAMVSQSALQELGEKLLAQGFGTVVIVDPLDQERACEMLGACLGKSGVSAVVFASPCVLLQEGTDRLEPAEIDRYLCARCNRCQQVTGCTAISFAEGVFAIDPARCAGCDLCVSACQSRVIYTPRLRMTPEERSALRYQAARS